MIKVTLPTSWMQLTPAAYERIDWCKRTFGKEHFRGRWWQHRTYLYFRDSNDYFFYSMAFSDDSTIVN